MLFHLETNYEGFSGMESIKWWNDSRYHSCGSGKMLTVGLLNYSKVLNKYAESMQCFW